MKKPKTETMLLVFMGKEFWRSTGKLVHAYRPLKSMAKGRPADLFFDKPLGCGKRGSDMILGVYKGKVSFKENEEDLSTVMVVHSIGDWALDHVLKDQDLEIKSTALSVAAKDEYTAFKKMKAAKSVDPIYECLEPIREALGKTNAAGRRAIIAKVLLHLGV